MEAEGALCNDGVGNGSLQCECVFDAGVAGHVTNEFIHRDYRANLEE